MKSRHNRAFAADCKKLCPLKSNVSVLVNTSVWVSHLRDGKTELATLRNNGTVVCHPLVVGEPACGILKDRAIILSLPELIHPMLCAP